MVKIGLICWQQGGGTNDYVEPKKQPWLKDVKIVQKGKYKGLIPFEKALQAALLHKYKDVEVSFINQFDEKKLEKNDVNFLVSLNLLAAWEKSEAEYKRVLKLMQKPSLNFYPNLKEQFFLFDKGDYLKYYQKRGIPIAPTFVIKEDRDPKKIIAKVAKEGWKSFVLKPHRAYANIGIGKFDRKHVAVNSVASRDSNSDTVLHSSISNPNVINDISKFLDKNKIFPAFVCQEVMNGFAKFWEIKSFWINGEFKYYVAMKAADKVFSESKIYGSNPEEFGTVSPKVLKEIKAMGRKVVDMFPKMNKHSDPPLYLRIDFGCCRDNTMDGQSYFLNEVEYAGCAIFTQEGVGKNIFDLWVNAYYKKAKEFSKSVSKKSSKRTNRKGSKRKGKRTKRVRRKLSNYHRGGVVTSLREGHKYTIANAGEIPEWTTDFGTKTMEYGIDYTLVKRDDNGQLYLESSEDPNDIFNIGHITYQINPEAKKNWAKMVDLGLNPKVNHKYTIAKAGEIPEWTADFGAKTMKYGINYTLVKRGDNDQLYLESSEDSNDIFHIGHITYQKKPEAKKNWAKMIYVGSYQADLRETTPSETPISLRPMDNTIANPRSYVPSITKVQPVEKGAENNTTIEVKYKGGKHKITHIPYGSTLLELLNQICLVEGKDPDHYSLIYAGKGTNRGDGGSTIRQLDKSGEVLDEREIEVVLRKII